MEKYNNQGIKNFIKKVEKKFKEHFVAYSIKNHKGTQYVNVIFDDSDVKNMDKADLISKLNHILEDLSKTLKKEQNKIKPKSILVSDINESNMWDLLQNYSVILDVKRLNSFINLKIPNDFLKVYQLLPEKFKLSDFEREIKKISKKAYHRNTYQNWLKSFKRAGFLKLKNKTYYKIEGPYKKYLLSNLDTNKK